ncbi:MAG: lytic transglycosylase domain-containing protein [Bacteriovoracaceae bacterium]|nr:lytic transglycosylase domain-containing protein [Bacteriovoracaceae bacterium]
MKSSPVFPKTNSRSKPTAKSATQIKHKSKAKIQSKLKNKVQSKVNSNKKSSLKPPRANGQSPKATTKHGPEIKIPFRPNPKKKDQDNFCISIPAFELKELDPTDVPESNGDVITELPCPDSTLMCPLGRHVVEGHWRVCANGKVTWVRPHTRRNRGKRPNVYLEENLLYLYWNRNKNYPPLNAIKGFPPHHELDPIIQFWLDYWKNKGVPFPEDLTPLHIKAIIAVESSFRNDARPDHDKSTAIGLMQLLRSTQSFLDGSGSNEIEDHLIQLNPEQLTDPVVNIAAGIRWLGHKCQLIKNKKQKLTAKNAIKWYHQANKEGDRYADKVLALYEKSK